MPGKRAFPKLEDYGLFAITKIILSSVKVAYDTEITSQLILNPVAANCRTEEMRREIIRYLSVLPSYLQHKISVLCFKLLTLDFTLPYHISYVRPHHKFLQILAETLFDATTEEVVSFSELRTLPVHSVLLKQLRTMCQLRVLKILNCFGLTIKSTSRNDAIIEEALCNMPYLEDFSFDHCTDSAIATISRSCKMIQKITVSFSNKVTNACIPALCLCEQLKKFLFYCTAITKSGYEKLILEHPRLETVDMIFIMTDEFLSATAQERGYLNSSTLVKSNKTLNMNTLCELSTKNPHITCLRLCLEFPKHLISLAVFPNVNYLVLFHYDYKMCLLDFHNALRVTGDAFIKLHFQTAIVDLNTLFITSSYCPNVREIEFFSIQIDSTIPVEAFRSVNTAPFQSTLKITVNLEEINKETDARRQFIKFLLSYCINIQSICIKGFAFDDELLHEIILSNPMKELEILILADRTQLTMKSVKLLMKKCDKLLYLRELNGWNIDDATQMRFRNLLDCNNINLLTSFANLELFDIDKLQTILRFKKFYDRLKVYRI